LTCRTITYVGGMWREGCGGRCLVTVIGVDCLAALWGWGFSWRGLVVSAWHGVGMKAWLGARAAVWCRQSICFDSIITALAWSILCQQTCWCAYLACAWVCMRACCACVCMGMCACKYMHVCVCSTCSVHAVVCVCVCAGGSWQAEEQ
jgi:hypothetical protein